MFLICFSDWNKYLKTYLNTNLEKNFSKLLETLKDCLQPKDQKPDNRPNCCELLQKINEFSVHKSLLTEDTETFEEVQTNLEMQPNLYLKKFFDHKINEQGQPQHNEQSNVNPLIDSLEYQISNLELDVGNNPLEDVSQMPVPPTYAITNLNEGSGDVRKMYKMEKRMALFLNVLKVC